MLPENVRFGFHLSINGGVASAAAEAKREGYGVFQMFVTNPRSWRITAVENNEAVLFRKIARECKSVPFAHAPYLCNPSSPRGEIQSKTIAALIGNMVNCSQLDIRYLVVHIGSHLGMGEENALMNATEVFRRVLDSTGDVGLLLENSAGYTNSFGSSFKEIAMILDSIKSKRLGICMDTCHAFSYGYNIATEAGTAALMDEIEATTGLDAVKLIHLNDSKYPIGSHLDRHWNIGKGYIGTSGFVEFFRNSRLTTKYFVMETPVPPDYDRGEEMEATKEILALAKQ